MTVRACVCSGGGALGARQIGGLFAAYRQHPELRFDAFFGVSTGALTAAMLAQGTTRDEQLAQVEALIDIYRGIRGNADIYRGPSTFAGQVWTLLRGQYFHGRPALYDPAPLRDLVAKHINPDRLREAGRPLFSCGVVHLEEGNYERFTGFDEHVLDAILASASMPIFFPPVQIGGAGSFQSLDGGLRNITPLHDAVSWLKAQPDPEKELWIFVTRRLMVLGDHRDRWTPAAVLGRTLNLVLNEVYRTDLTMLRRRNTETAAAGGRYKRILHTLDIPSRDYGHALDFRPTRIRAMLHDGLAAAIRRPGA